MSQEMIIGLGILAVAILLTMIAYFLRSNRQEQQRRTLSVIYGKAAGPVKESARDLQDRRRADLARKLQQNNESATKKKNGGIRDRLNQAGLDHVPTKKYWIICVVVAVLVMVLSFVSGQSPLLVVLFTIVAGLGLPQLVLKFKIGRRQKKFLEDFADALESMVRLLKAGMPVGEAIAMVAREYTGPIGEEMSKIYEEQKIGITLPEACLRAAERMPIAEMKMFATGISIQQQTGSSLSEILTNLARVIRARFRLRRKISALSAEAKASAAIIGLLPVVVAGGLYAVNPEYMHPLFFTLKGKYYLSGAGGLMLLGCLIMRQMINFKI